MANLLRTLTSLAVAVGITAVAVPATATAASSPTAYNTWTQELTNHPNPGMPISCVDRTIDLREGHYNWGLKMGGSERVMRTDLFLGTDRYGWHDCLVPGDNVYGHASSLKARNHPDWPEITISRSWTLSAAGVRTWGSFLDPLDF
ncbi:MULTISPECIES: hypothetical protein [Amycolatopsis]|uniref:Secreted protein n=1 Tax=Amycolatopsis bullii TaxID=941987 RepID=A0ABQ3KBX3_9PSEU|nr:hypothetical protein [Amycolatopsis bullii]GHG03808.1 hypothetical protein GCM10017567_19660 [Amycolatopsis bullii]